MAWLIQAVLLNAMLASLLGLAAWLVGRNGRRPALAHALWVLVLVKLITPPLMRWPVELEVGHDSWAASVLTPAEAELEAEATAVPVDVVPVVFDPGRAIDPAMDVAAAPESDAATGLPVQQVAEPRAADRAAAATPTGVAVPWMRWFWYSVLAAWVAGIAVRGRCCILRLRHFARTLRLGTPVDAALKRRVDSLARGLGLSRGPAVVALDGPMSPLLWGFGRRATIVLPTSLWERLTDTEQDAVLVHELAHYARRDHLVRILELVVSVLYWWNPLVWMARRQIETTEEQCCDAWVVGQTPSGPRTYAEALLTTIDFISEHRIELPPAASGVTDVSAIERRLQQIMCETVPRSLNSTMRGVVLGLVVLLPLQPLLLAAPGRIVSEWTAPLDGAQAQKSTGSVEDPPPGVSAPSGKASSLPPVEPDAALLESVIFQTGPSEMTATAVSPNGLYRLVAESGGRVWLEEPGRKRKVDLTTYQLTTAAFYPDSRHFVGGSADGSVRVWSCETGATTSLLGRHRSEVRSVDVSADGRRVVTGDRDGNVWLFRIDQSEGLTPISQADSVRPITSLRFSPDGRVVAAAVGDSLGRTQHGIELFEVDTQSKVGHLPTEAPIASLEFAAADRLLATDGLGRVTVWDPQRAYVVERGEISKEDVYAARFSPDTQAFDSLRPDDTARFQAVRDTFNPVAAGL